MKKKHLKRKLKQLEARVAELEARQRGWANPLPIPFEKQGTAVPQTYLPPMPMPVITCNNSPAIKH